MVLNLEKNMFQSYEYIFINFKSVLPSLVKGREYGSRIVPGKKYILSGGRHLLCGGRHLIIWRPPLNLCGGRHLIYMAAAT